MRRVDPVEDSLSPTLLPKIPLRPKIFFDLNVSLDKWLEIA